jgi:hypothetical protein
MARIQIVTSDGAGGLRAVLFSFIRRSRNGYVPGIAQILMPDLMVAAGVDLLYRRIHLAKSSALTRLQREMVATIVNGKVGGAP